MSRSTDSILAMLRLDEKLGKAIVELGQHIDAKQWSYAGVALGKIQSLAESIREIAHVTAPLLWEDSQ